MMTFNYYLYGVLERWDYCSITSQGWALCFLVPYLTLCTTGTQNALCEFPNGEHDTATFAKFDRSLCSECSSSVLSPHVSQYGERRTSWRLENTETSASRLPRRSLRIIVSHIPDLEIIAMSACHYSVLQSPNSKIDSLVSSGPPQSKLWLLPSRCFSYLEPFLTL